MEITTQIANLIISLWRHGPHYLSIALYIWISLISIFIPQDLDFPMPLPRFYDLYHIAWMTFHNNLLWTLKNWYYFCEYCIFIIIDFYILYK